jgi:DNA-directed RNA polymerase specialized sigma24 family protein
MQKPMCDQSISLRIGATYAKPLVLADEEGSSVEACRADARLAARCLAGEVVAWEELYSLHHPRLLTFIRQRLGPGKSDPNLVDEITARVWYALVADDGKLLERYDPERGARLITFLYTLAKGILSNNHRSEHRRRKRELLALTAKSRGYATNTGETDAMFAEFRETLTPHENDFMEKQLMAENSEGMIAAKEQPQKPVNRAASWQSTHRIYRKLLTFLGM